MKHLRTLSLLFFPGVLLSLSLPVTVYAATENVCITCHKTLKAAMRTPVEKWELSIHKNAGVTCVDCHGGNPLSKKAAMEKESGFTGAPLRGEIPELCARCHSDIKKMRKYNLRTDQFSQYRTSAHGVGLFEDDNDNVPTCVDCHNSHDIFSKNNPASPVYRFNIARTCDRCHGDEEVMEEYGGPVNQLALYKESVHGTKLFKEQNLNVPTCVDCHGNHGSSPRGITGAGAACRTCHPGVFDHYRKSPHANAARRGSEVSCVQCHGNHKIDKPSRSKFSGFGKTDCGGCHPKESPEYATGLIILKKLEGAASSITDAKISFESLKNKQGAVYDSAGLQGKISKAEMILSETIPVTHSLLPDAVARGADKVTELSKSASNEIEKNFSELDFRKLFLFISWFFIIITIILFRRLIKTLS